MSPGRCCSRVIVTLGFALLARGALADPPVTPQRVPTARPAPAPLTAPLASFVDALLKEAGLQRDQAIEAVSRLTPQQKEAVFEELCRRTLDARSREPALRALKKVSPWLFQPVRALTTLQDSGSHAGAFRTLQELGVAGRPAFPVVLWATERVEAEFRKFARLQNESGQVSVFGLGLAHGTLAGLARHDERAFQALLKRANFGLDDKGRPQYDAILETFLAGESAPTSLLSRIAQATPTYRAQVVPVLARQLELSGEGRVLLAIQGLTYCGAAAKSALDALEKLETAPNAAVQNAATQAVRTIEGLVRVEAIFGPDPSLNLLCDKYGDADPFVRSTARELLSHKHPRLNAYAEQLFYEAERDGTRQVLVGGLRNAHVHGVFSNLGKVIEEIGKANLEGEAVAALLLGHLNYVKRLKPKGEPGQVSARVSNAFKPSSPIVWEEPKDSSDYDNLEFLHHRVLARVAPKDAQVRKAQVELCLQWLKEGRAVARKKHKNPDYAHQRPAHPGETLALDMMAIVAVDDLTVPEQLLQFAEDHFTEMKFMKHEEWQKYYPKNPELNFAFEMLGGVAEARPAMRRRIADLAIQTMKARVYLHLWDRIDAEVIRVLKKCAPDVIAPLEKTVAVMTESFQKRNMTNELDDLRSYFMALHEIKEAERKKAQKDDDE